MNWLRQLISLNLARSTERLVDRDTRLEDARRRQERQLRAIMALERRAEIVARRVEVLNGTHPDAGP